MNCKIGSMENLNWKRLRAFMHTDKGRLTNIVVTNATIFLLLFFFWHPKIDSFPPELVKVERLCDSHPDSALHVLAEFDTTKCMPGAISYYKFLEIKGRSLSQDSYHIAADCLNKVVIDMEYLTPPPRTLADLYYIVGKVLFQANDYPQAQPYFQKALTQYSALKDGQKQGECSYLLGEILRSQCLYRDAAKRFSSSENFFIQGGDSVGLYSSLRKLAFCQRELGQTAQAKQSYRKALEIAQQCSAHQLEADLRGEYAAWLLDEGKIREAQQVLSSHSSTSATRENSANRVAWARLYNLTGQHAAATAKCKEVMRDGTVDERLDAAHILAAEAQQAGQLSEALHYTQMSLAMADSMRQRDAVLAISQMNAAYNYENYAQQEYQLRKDKFRQEVAIDIILGVLVLVVLFFSWRLYRLGKNRKVQLRRYAEVVASLHETEEERKQLQRQLDEREKEYTNLTAQAGEQDKKLISIRKNPVYRKFKSAANADSGRSIVDETDWQSMESLVYGEFPHLQTVLLNLPNLSEQNRNMCLLIKLEFKPIEIARLLCRDKSTINSSRRRLYERVFGEKGSPALWDEFIQSV